MEIETPPEDNSDARQDPMRSLDAELIEHYKLLYMLEPGDHLNSKLGLQDLYRTSLLTTVFCREPLTALYTHSPFQTISVIAGSYLVIRAYLRSSQYRDDQHRMVKFDTVLIQNPYQRNPTWIDFSLASCAWEENLHLVLELVQGFAIILSSLFAHFCITRAPRKVNDRDSTPPHPFCSASLPPSSLPPSSSPLPSFSLPPFPSSLLPLCSPLTHSSPLPCPLPPFLLLLLF